MRVVLRSSPLIAAVVCLGVLAAAAAAGAYLWFIGAVPRAPGPLASPVTIVIPPGSGLKGIARQLARRRRGAARTGWWKPEARRLQRSARALKPGEYKFDANEHRRRRSANRAGARLWRITSTIPERIPVIASRASCVCSLPRPVLQGAVTEPPHDGDLLPETYRYEWGDTRAGLIGRMKQARDALLAELWAARAGDFPAAEDLPAEAVVCWRRSWRSETGLAAGTPKQRSRRCSSTACAVACAFNPIRRSPTDSRRKGRRGC